MRIEIVEIRNRGIWDVWHNGELICERTRTPLCSAARILLARGTDPNIILEKVRCGSDRVDQRARIGDAAKLAVLENETRGPYFTKYKAFTPFKTAADVST
jgi:hypothetical protein